MKNTSCVIGPEAKNAVRWKNHRAIDWNRCDLRLSRMVPEGCSTEFGHSQLTALEHAVDAVLRPYWGTNDWKKRAPIGAVIVSELISAMGMFSSCYTYGNAYEGTKYYRENLNNLFEIGLSPMEAETELKALVKIFTEYYRKHSMVHFNVHTDSEGCTYNGLECQPVRMNVIVDDKYDR